MSAKASPAVGLLAGLGLLLLLQAPVPTLAARKPSIDPVSCVGKDLTGLTVVNVTAGAGQARLLADAAEACADTADNVTENTACVADWDSKDERKAGRQLGRMVAEINKHLQKHEVEKYDKLKSQAKADKAANQATDNTTSTSDDSADPEPFDVLEEPPAEYNLTETEKAAWKSAASGVKARRGKGRPNPKGKKEEDGFGSQLVYVCHQVEGKTVSLYMQFGDCTSSDPCDDFDTVE